MKHLHTFVYAFVIFSIVFDLCLRKERSKYFSDVGLSVPELVKKHGYYVEKQEVETADGYLLEMHRIPYGTKKPNSTERRIPVLLIHCFMCSSAEWLYIGPEKSIGYILADAGYDVWMANHRGTTYSKKHKTLDPTVENGGFWNFSLHDLSVSDIPAMIDFILNKTGHDSLHMMGHSQGTLTTFAMLAAKPEYNKKVKLFSAYSPAVYIDCEGTRNTYSFITWPIARIFTNFFEWGEGFSRKSILAFVAGSICNEESIFFYICKRSMMRVVGAKTPKYDHNMLQLVMSHNPAGTSWKIIEHFYQLIGSSEFKPYDYGLEGNMKEYNQTKPPMYKISNIEAPIALYYAKSDAYVDAANVIRLANELPNVHILHHIDDENWTHTDFLWADDAKDLLYQKTLTEMAIYNNKT